MSAPSTNRQASTGDDVVNKKKLVDDICQAWFVSHNMGSDENGRIHYRSKEGELSKEVVPPAELRRLMEDPETGVVAKAKQLAPKLDFSLFWSPPELREYAAQQAGEGARVTKGLGSSTSE